jgi:hypothetical protein
MPERQTLARAKRDKALGRSASTQAGEFVREEVRHVKEGKHGAKSRKQAIAIGLSKARRSGVKLGAPSARKASKKTRQSARSASRKGRAGPLRSIKAGSRSRVTAKRRAAGRKGGRAAARSRKSMRTRSRPV